MGLGCSVYNESLLLDGAGGASGAGGAAPVECGGGDCWWSTERADSCRSAGIPGPASRPDPAGIDPTELPPIYLGLEKLRLGTTLPDGTADDLAWQGFGFDLDGLCTNSSTCPGATEVGCTSPSPQIPFDGLNCRDNTFARLQPIAAMVPQIGQTFGLGEDAFNCAIWNGAYNIIAKVSGYNGTQNDDSIRIDFYASTGLESSPGWMCPLEDFANTYPRWRVSSRWRVADDDFAAPDDGSGQVPPSRFADPAAFVKDGYFVARLPNGAPLRLPGDNFIYPGFNLKLQGGIWTGRITKAQDGTFRVEDGLSAGRVTKTDLINAFREIGFCEDQGVFWTTLNGYVNENADVMADGSINPSAECDAMSVGIGFVAAELSPGSPATPKPPPGCAPMN